MHKYIFLTATILIVAIIAFGCSTGSSPTAPGLRDNLAPRDSSGIGQTGLVGLWQVAIDLNNQTIEAVPARTSDLMLNVLGFMEPPALDKMTIDFDTLVIDFEEVFLIDDTGAAAITGLFEYAQRYGVELSLARVHSGTHELLKLSGVTGEIGEHRIYDTVRNAVEAATRAQPESDSNDQDSGRQ